jgi:hypothetical protein
MGHNIQNDDADRGGKGISIPKGLVSFG